MASLFDHQRAYKPFTHPEIVEFVNIINQVYWTHTEKNFTADRQAFQELQPHEQEAIKRSLLCIAQVEVDVKSFWGNLYKFIPKPEFNGLGATFAECEFRHSEAYSRLLDVLSVPDFATFIERPSIKRRLDVLKEYLAVDHRNFDKQEYYMALVVFSCFIENVSLFSQFAVILSFNRFKGIMKDVANIIKWTSVDENCHAQAGIYIAQLIQKECKFDQERLGDELFKLAQTYMENEQAIIDMIFERGELSFLPKEQLLSFVKHRFNTSMELLGFKHRFELDEKHIEAMTWFEEEVFGAAQTDFFAMRPTDYTKHDKVFAVEELF